MVTPFSSWFERFSRDRGLFRRCAVIFLFAAFILPQNVSAAVTPSYRTTLQSLSATNLTMKPGEEKQVTVRFKNTGTKTWRKSGAAYVSLYTWNPKYHPSPIVGANWKSSSQTNPLAADTAPGSVGAITFSVKAPAVPGTYHEHFHLAVEETAWVAGGSFALSVTVTGAPVSGAPSAPSAGTLQATRLLMSAQNLALRGGERAEMSVLFKNSGTADWTVRKLVQDTGLRIAAADAPTFFDASWASEQVALAVSELVPAGRTSYVRFAVKAPVKRGEYVARFKLVVDEKEVPGGSFDLPVTVTEDAPAIIDLPSVVSPPPANTLLPEPQIRVGTAMVTISSLVLSSTSELMVHDLGGAELGRIAPGIAATVTVGPAGTFKVTGATVPLTLTGAVRFVPVAGEKAATRIDAGGSESWSTWVNGGRMRGTVEIRYYAPADVTWVINELPMESYLYGLAEMSNNSPMEYQKALIIAARTYAYWQLTHPGKYVTFTVNSTEGDQVYRGHNRELQQPNTVRAVDETRGMTIHHNGTLVLTPYYANSDGRTRAWTEVWGGVTRPWLVSVPAIHDIGRRLFGHGVGMSARDASDRASRDGWNYDQLVKHYYTGVEIKKLW